MTKALKAGTRVVKSKGRGAGSKRGVVASPSLKYKNSVWVKWDGNKRVAYVSLFELAPEQ